MKRIFSSTLLVAVMALIATSWLGCDSADQDSGATLSGVVREAGPATPLSDITVALNGVQTTTDQNGRFAFQEVLLGAGTLQVTAAGFDTYTKLIDVAAGDNSLDVSLTRKFDLQFDHANILVHDLRESTTFYKDVLGLSQIASPFGSTSPVAVFSIGLNQQIHAIEDPAFEPDTGAKQNHIALSVQDFDAALNLLRDEQIDFGPFCCPTNGAFQTRPDGVRQIYFQDPVGNWIEINDAQYDSQGSTYIYDHQGIFTNSLEGSRAFYTNILHLREIVSPWNDTSVTRFFSLGDNGEIHLNPSSEGAYRKRKREHMTFNVNAFDQYLIFLTSNGVRYDNFSGDAGQVDTRPDGVRQIYLQDFDGNWIEIIDAQY